MEEDFPLNAAYVTLETEQFRVIGAVIIATIKIQQNPALICIQSYQTQVKPISAKPMERTMNHCLKQKVNAQLTKNAWESMK